MWKMPSILWHVRDTVLLGSCHRSKGPGARIGS
jgi:hypothetical protein